MLKAVAVLDHVTAVWSVEETACTLNHTSVLVWAARNEYGVVSVQPTSAVSLIPTLSASPSQS